MYIQCAMRGMGDSSEREEGKTKTYRRRLEKVEADWVSNENSINKKEMLQLVILTQGGLCETYVRGNSDNCCMMLILIQTM